MTTNDSVRVRFAPSPTGHLHVGGARTAIFNWLFARHGGGAFIVRVEDTDQERSTLESERMVLDDLRWLGLEWDEGPDKGGPHGPYRQSERRQLYAAVAGELIATGHAYRCFCSEEELERKRKAVESEGGAPQYDLTCHRLGADESEARRAAGLPFAIRFHVAKEGDSANEADVTINDLIRGEVSWGKESLGDFIVVRTDGMPTYNFSVVVDDHDMEITHVIRAEEHLTNTHRQVLIYRALGWSIPRFAHVSLILGEDRTKLSKRHGATSVSAWADAGYLPEAMVNYLTLLGWSAPNGSEIFPVDYAIAEFSLQRVNAAPAVFDPKKLDWVNNQYIQTADLGRLRGLLAGGFREAGWLTAETERERVWFEAAIDLVRKGARQTAEIIPALRFFFVHDPLSILSDSESRTALGDEASRDVLEALAEELRSNGGPSDPEQYKQMAERVRVASGQKGKALFMPMRLALTGTMHGPELQRAVPLMETGSRLEGLAPIRAPLERIEAVLRELER